MADELSINYRAQRGGEANNQAENAPRFPIDRAAFRGYILRGGTFYPTSSPVATGQVLSGVARRPSPRREFISCDRRCNITGGNLASPASRVAAKIDKGSTRGFVVEARARASARHKLMEKFPRVVGLIALAAEG